MILFLDDESTGNLFCEELETKQLPLQVFSRIDDAWEFLQKTTEEVSIAIIDVMMPPGDLFTLAETNDGLTSGLLFYERLRGKLKDCRVFFLTNLTSPEVEQAISKDENAQVRIKTDFFYDEFADEVESLYKEMTSGSLGGKE